MGEPSFKPIALRMERASEHAANLKAEIRNFLEGNPYALVHEFDPERFADVPPGTTRRRGVHLYRVDARPVPDRIAILAGDVLKDLRSALDYVAWQLALARSDTPPPTTAFPIFAKQELYERDRLRFIRGIDEAIHADFDAVQPYHAGDKAMTQPLWVLHRMANDDKHKVPHLVGSIPTGFGVRRPDPKVDLVATMKTGAFDADQIVAEVAITKGPVKKEPEIDVTFDIEFGEQGPGLAPTVFAEVNRIGVEVDKVLSRFRPFF